MDEGPIADFVAAVRGKDKDAVNKMLRASPDLVSSFDPNCFGATPLIQAVSIDSREMVDLLLDAGANIDQRSDWWAGSFGVLDHGSDEMCRHLIARGATLTPHAAARLGMLGELRVMVEEDPSCVNSRGGDGQFPLHFSRTVEIAELILGSGAEIDARDIDHESTAAQWLATSRREVAKYLVSRGAEADPFLAVTIGNLNLLKKMVGREKDGVNVAVTTERFATKGEKAAHQIYFYTIGNGCGLLHAAANANQAEAIRWLVREGCDPNLRAGYDDQTPLHAAAWHDSADAATALLDAGAEINARSGNVHENEPLGWAIVSGASDFVRVALARGAIIKDNHRREANAGINGEYCEFNQNRPMEKWAEIHRMISG